MITQKIDARGFACPEPVLMTKNKIDSDHPDTLIVMVDNEAAVENVSRFLGTCTYETKVTPKDSDFEIHAQYKGETGQLAEQNDSVASETDKDEVPEKIMVFAATDRMGFGDDELGKKLMISFIKTLKEMGDDLWRLVFVNNGVKLTIEGSPVLEALQAYEKEGLTILVCGTCLTHFDLMKEKRVGVTTNMLDIVTALQLADKVIHP